MTNQERLQANNAKIEAIQQTLVNKVATSGEIELTENNKTYDVSKYASARTNIAVPDLSETTATENDVVSGKVFYNASGEKTTGTYVDFLQWKCDNMNSLYQEFYHYPFESVDDFFSKIDTSNVTNFGSCFYNANITTQPAFSIGNTSNISFNNAFYKCGYLKSFSYTQANNVRNWSYCFKDCNQMQTLELNVIGGVYMAYLAHNCPNLITVSLIDMGVNQLGNQSLEYAFAACSKLTTITGLDLINNPNINSMLTTCKNLTNLDIKNIQKTIQIGYTDTWGHLLTLDSLLNAAKELWINTGTSTLSFLVGTANLEKLANVYVKLIDITDEMRAEDQYIDNKAPFVQCESTDEGAMLISEYVTTVKNWKLA